MMNGIVSKTLLALSLAVPAVALSACGDDDDDKKGTSTSGTTTSSNTGSGSASKTSTTGSGSASKTGTTGGGNTSNTSSTSKSGSTSNTDTSSTGAATKNLNDLAKANADFTTFVELVRAAGLESAMTGTEKLTVFAPTNAAFNKIAPAKLAELKGNATKLSAVLLGHVIPGSIKSTDLKAIQKQKSKGKPGEQLTLVIKKDNTGVTVNDAKVIKPDLMATNGVIHGIDTVVMAPTDDIATLISNNPELSKLKAAIDKAELAATFQGQGPITVFAPNNAAFDKLGSSAPSDKAGLTPVIQFHGTKGEFFSFDLTNNQSITTLLTGKKQTVTVGTDGVKYGSAKVVTADIRAKNGVIHIIDTVVTPAY